MQIVLTTGGTGGHIFPALAVASKLKELAPNHELLFVGSSQGLEAKLVSSEDIAFFGLNVQGFLGRGLRSLKAFFLLGLAFLKARKLLKEKKARVVAGFGGYASLPCMLAAQSLGLPTLIHEQNAILGYANKLLSYRANCLCQVQGVPKTLPNGKSLIVGNPVRTEIASLFTAEKKEPCANLLIIGGSQGAHALNVFICQNLKLFKEAKISLFHQTGVQDYAMVLAHYKQEGLDPTSVSAFINDMPGAYRWADLVLARSGASTIAELTCAGLPAILVPFPSAIHDHQTKNAEVLESCNAAKLWAEASLNSGRAQELVKLIYDANWLKEVSQKTRGLAMPYASNLVAQEILSLLPA